MGPGDLVRHHRSRRRLSQLELAAAAGISTRHLSYVERGRSRAGRAVLVALARALGLPAREANALLRAAGERPAYPDHRLDEAAVRPMRAALERMLAGHMPLPALVTDHRWMLIEGNAAFDALVRRLAAASGTGIAAGGNVLEWLFAADGLRPLVVNWPAVGVFMLERLRREALLRPELDALVARLESELGHEEAAVAEPEGTVLPLRLAIDGRELRLFSVLAAFGSALDAGMQDLRIEYIFAEDGPSEAWLEGLTVSGAA